ncbi:MAG TPA: hypothetical protein VLA66_10475, partial [Thermoanaerobaculia bacterium]|nr:hypothetical protein [Thermoanaerobaculia bacterium]
MIRVASWASRASLAAAILLAAAPILERFAPDTWPGGPWFSLGLLGLLLLRLGCGRAARGDWRLPPLETALVSAWAVYALAVSNGGARTSSDNLPARELGANVLDGRGLDLGELAARRPGDEYSLVEVRGRWLPAFPLGTGFLALPHEAMARAAAVAPPDEATRLLREKHAAALLSALAVGLMAAGLLTRWPTLPALGSALAFGLASPHL